MLTIGPFDPDDELHVVLQSLLGPFEPFDGVAYAAGDNYAHGVVLRAVPHSNGVTECVNALEFAVRLATDEWTVQIADGRTATSTSDYWK